MICPACRSDRAYVYRTSRTLTETTRSCRCDCGASWLTDEKVRRGSLKTSSASYVAQGQRTDALQAADEVREAASKIKDLAIEFSDSSVRGGGLGGASGSLFPIPVSPPSPSQQSGSEVLGRKKTRARSNPPRPFDSKPGFGRLWEATGRIGGKQDAFDAYCRMEAELPSHEEHVRAWEAYLATLSDPTKANHLSTWLNKRRWADSWVVAKPQPREKRYPDHCDWHQDPRHLNFASHRPLEACPQCRHLKRLAARRESEPELIGDLPMWAGAK